jgi:Tfp pilus assembly PilM family ATPase
MSAFALIRSLYRREGDDAERVLYLNVDGLTNVAIAEGTVCRFTRVLGGGIEEIAAELAERRGIPIAVARELLAEVDLATTPDAAGERPRAFAADASAGEEPRVERSVEREPAGASEHHHAPEPSDAPELAGGAESAAAPWAPTGGAEAYGVDVPGAAEPVEHEHEHALLPEELIAPTGPGAHEDARAVLESGIRAIAGEVRNSLDFHRSQESGGDVSRVILSGSALELPGFAEALQTSLGVDVQGETIGVAEGTVLSGVSAHRLAVATGLAATEVTP